MKKIKIELGRQTNFVLALLLIYFVFFGYICNIYKKFVGFRLLFLYQVLFNPESVISLLILFLIIFIIALREDFFEYAMRNTIWLTIIIILISWVWYWIIYGFDITIIGTFFANYQGYLTILSLLTINLLSAISAVTIKHKYREAIGKSKGLITQIN